MSFWGELRRRNVFKVGTAYLLVAWLLIQVVNNVAIPLDLPSWTPALVIVLLGVGFPIALLFAWAYEVTPKGLKRTSEVTESERITHVTGQRLNFVVSGLLLVTVLYLAADLYLFSPADSASRLEGQATSQEQALPSDAPEDEILPNSVAVLPLENLSPDPENAVYAQGMHAEIINQLSKLSHLTVVSRGAVLGYEPGASSQQVASELRVQSVLRGSFQYIDGRIRIVLSLVDPRTRTNLSAMEYEDEFADIFAVQADIATNVANALDAEFSAEERARIEKVPTQSSEAYAHYLEAVSTPVMQAISTPAAPRMVDALNDALQIDPEFAEAHAGKAYVYAMSTVNTTGGGAQSDWTSVAVLARRSAERALEIDPSMARAHVALALVNMFTWRWNEAHRSALAAEATGLSTTAAIWPVAWFRAFGGDHEKAIRLARRGVRLAFSASRSHMDLAIAYEYAGHIDMAIDAFGRAITADPGNLLARQHLGLLHARVGNDAAATTQFEYIEGSFDDEVQFVFLPELAMGYAMVGRAQDAARLANDIFSTAEERDVGAGSLAMAYLAVGDTQNAAAELEAAVRRVESNEPDQGFFSLMLIKHNVIGHPALAERRFAELRNQIGRL